MGRSMDQDPRLKISIQSGLTGDHLIPYLRTLMARLDFSRNIEDLPFMCRARQQHTPLLADHTVAPADDLFM